MKISEAKIDGNFHDRGGSPTVKPGLVGRSCEDGGKVDNYFELTMDN